MLNWYEQNEYEIVCLSRFDLNDLNLFTLYAEIEVQLDTRKPVNLPITKTKNENIKKKMNEQT